MEINRREEAEKLIQKILKEKSFSVITQDEKNFLFEEYTDEMKIESKSYEKYLGLSDTEKLENIMVHSLKEYIGGWHVTPEEMSEISNYIQSFSVSK